MITRFLYTAFFFVLYAHSAILFAQGASEELGLLCQDNQAAKLWSDPSTWESGKVPEKHEDITIPRDLHVLMDLSPPSLGEVTVAGKLSFAEQELALDVEQLYIEGTVCIGTEEEARANKLTLTLTGQKEGSATFGNRGILIMSQANFIIDAKATLLPFTKLAETADAGATSILLEAAVDWQIGDSIVLSSSDYAWRQAESRIITAIIGNKVSFAEPLNYQHFGDLQMIVNQVVDTRAEVVHLSRRVVIQGANDSLTTDDLQGGHVMAMKGSTVKIDGVEFRRMGQAGKTGRYPLHWHLAGDATGSYVKNSSFHNNFNRCITIHNSQNILIENNVAFRTFGHCYFLEDGSEFGNIFRANIGLSIDKPKAEHVILPSDIGFLGPSVFWITHPDNLLENNIAAGSDGTGFWYAFPKHPTGLSEDSNIPLLHIEFGGFVNNIAHSNSADGLRFDDGPDVQTLVPDTVLYEPLINPFDANSEVLNTELVGFVAFKNRNNGAWVRIHRGYMTDCILSDNAVGANLSGHNSYLDNCLIVGESANFGTPESWEPSAPDGGSLPKPWLDCQRCIRYNIRGFELYDGKVWVQNSTFANFENNSLRRASAFSQLDYSSFEVNPLNYIENVTFGEGTNPVYFETRTIEDLLGEPGEDGYRSTVFQDVDGSLGIEAGSFVTVNNSFLTHDDCYFQTAWNAFVCSPDSRYVSLRFDAQNAGHLVLKRNDGENHFMTGVPERKNWYKGNVLLGYDYQLDYANSAVSLDDFRIGIGDGLQVGDSLVINLPYENDLAFVYLEGWNETLSEIMPVYESDRLHQSEMTRYYIDNNRLYIKIVVVPNQDKLMLRVCAKESCEFKLETESESVYY